MSTPRQLLAYKFPPGSGFEGHLVGALERIESGGTMRIRDALFVGRDPDSGETIAASLTSEGSSGMIGRLLSFRMDQSARAKATERAMAGPSAQLVRSLAAELESGEAIAAVLVEHVWQQMLGEAIARMGGDEVENRFVEGDRIEELQATR